MIPIIGTFLGTYLLIITFTYGFCRIRYGYKFCSVQGEENEIEYSDLESIPESLPDLVDINYTLPLLNQ